MLHKTRTLAVLLGLLVATIGGKAPFSAVSIVRQLPPGLVGALDKVLRGERVLRAPSQPEFDNVCAEATSELEYIPPFVCVFQKPVVAVQLSLEYSLSWIFNHTDPALLLGIVCPGKSDSYVVPPAIGRFKNLVGISFGVVKAPFPSSEIGNLVNLEAFEIRRLEGTIAVPPFDRLHELRVIVVNAVSGGMTGELNSLEKLTQLDTLDFAYCSFSGLPPSTWDLKHLSRLDVRGNLLNSPLPEKFPPRAFELLLADAGLHGPIPKGLTELLGLESLQLAGNEISGTIPYQIALLTKLTSLTLGNLLEGAIPTQLGLLTGLQELSLGNGLAGTLPSQLGNLTELKTLEVSNNGLHGTLPSQLARLSRLTFLGLGNNDFEGDPTFLCAHLTNLKEVTTTNNSFHGSTSECERVWEHDCDFSGLAFPCRRELGACSGWEYEFTRGDPESGRNGRCEGPDMYLGIPAAVSFPFFLGVLLASLRAEDSHPRDGGKARKCARAVCWAAAATLEVVNSWVTLLVVVQAPELLLLSLVGVVPALTHGIIGCYFVPALDAFHRRDAIAVALSPLLLAEVPWRAVLGRNGRERRRLASDAAKRGSRNTPAQPEQGVQHQVLPSEYVDRAHALVEFTLRTAKCRVLACLAMLVCQAVLAATLKSNLAWLALWTGIPAFAVAVGVWHLAHRRSNASKQSR